MTQIRQSCPNCGGELSVVSEELLRCPYCESDFENHSFRRKFDILQEFLDQAKIEAVNNQRRNLYDAIQAKYISKNDVRLYATEIKKYLPDDFQANFYLEALSGDVKKINELIRGIDVEENYEFLQPIVRFLTASLQSEFLLELNLLIERAYQKRDPALYSKYATQISAEAEKVSAGVYETFMPRDVFIAYSSKDMKIVSKLCEELEEQGFSCFVAARNLRHGVGSVENYDDALKEAMDYCTCFLFVSSVNSRKFDCDAVRKEIPYIRSTDAKNAPPEYRHNYKTMPAKYKKPRIEYRVGTIVRSATNAVTNEFFDGYEWVYDTDGVIDRLVQILTATPEDDLAEAPAAPVITPAPQKKVCNHVEVIDPAVEATCTTPGRTEGSHCVLCGEILRQSVTIAPRGHEFGAWTVKKPASCTEDGKQERTCHCGEKETKTIPFLGGHKPGEWVTVKEATESEQGLKVKKCTVCGEHTAEDKIPKLSASPIVKNENEKMSALSTVKASQGLVYKINADGKTCSVKGQGTCKDKDIVIPEMIDGYKVTGIITETKDCFRYGISGFDKDIKSVNIPNSVIIIGNDVFRSCTSLASVTIPDSVTSIGVSAFSGCTSLASVNIPDSVTSIGNSAFSGCTSLASVSIPDSVTSIGGWAFKGCKSLSSVSIPDSVTSIGDSAFAWCTSLASVSIPDSVTSIEGFAFSGCTSLASVSIPDSVTSIGNSAFYSCTSLTSVSIPDSVTSIDYRAFAWCTSLSSLRYKGTKNQWKNISLGSSWKKISSIRKIECTDGDIKFLF